MAVTRAQQHQYKTARLFTTEICRNIQGMNFASV